MDSQQYISYLIKLISDRSETLFVQKAGPIPVTAPQGRLLMYLESHRATPVSQRELERYLGVSHTTVKGLLQRLEEKGLVRTAFDSTDGRIKHAYLTEHADRMHEGIVRYVDEFENQLLRDFTEEDKTQLRALLKRLYANLLP